ncbi:hypothetical protein KIN20_022825 [Parelaphostrongylus tenuis]|uniref:K Homology domain-containing protein n=1 Tax=Parelaphostrongylus tenuis TaxID=148309 RepID=A0AAD5MQQ5_PARTN|nr:hypothetical protein KIN20_022825 [Parelaphostrongylus tenuis]
MFNQRGLGDLEIRHSSEVWIDGDREVCPILDLTSGSRSIVENSSRDYWESSGDGVTTQMTCIRFFVNILDALRLIGLGGVTIRRIQELHPEMRKNDEIVVEVFSTSLKQCESARQHVLAFLAGASLRADRPVGSSSKKKEIRVPPKILLELKPKKMPSKQTD